VPGIIGQVGTAFGKLGVNIAQMTVGRSAPGGDAIGVLNLDQAPDEHALAEVLACQGIKSAKVVKMPPAGQLPNWLAIAGPTTRSGADGECD
jgi:D-3-phosphoglycerate dehydrogenase